jgi:hypothetical protein
MADSVIVNALGADTNDAAVTHGFEPFAVGMTMPAMEETPVYLAVRSPLRLHSRLCTSQLSQSSSGVLDDADTHQGLPRNLMELSTEMSGHFLRFSNSKKWRELSSFFREKWHPFEVRKTASSKRGS